MKKVPTIALDDLPRVMVEVIKELKPLLNREGFSEEQRAIHIYIGTLSLLMHDIFDYLPPGQQDEILTNCGTWFDIGVLFGKSPKVLLEILNRVNPKIESWEAPDWFADRLTEAAEQKES